jgi:helicase required for RNAi-mediated heterochromatin assembly 1
VDDVELPSNVCDGPYHSVEEYLSTHYELLREDAFASLREAVLHMREFPDSDDNQHITVYENVSYLQLGSHLPS